MADIGQKGLEGNIPTASGMKHWALSFSTVHGTSFCGNSEIIFGVSVISAERVRVLATCFA
jgi:hypothetical protein